MVKYRPMVFLAPSSETASQQHEVIWAKDGILAGTAQKGNIKRFDDFDQAIDFARKKAVEIGNAELTIRFPQEVKEPKDKIGEWDYRKPSVEKAEWDYIEEDKGKV